MGKIDNYESYDALDLAQLVRKGDVSATELLEAAIESVEERNPTLNAVVTPMYDEARQSIEAGLPDGPLRGVPFLLKDLGAFYNGVKTSYGSTLYAAFVPDHDSEIVIRYRKAGLVICGKTNTPEFGLTVTTEPRLFGPCRNPWNLDRTTGGSSGGAAAAVASGMVPAAHASDGGGSIRIPASCCGLFGLKPTRGRVSMGPDLGEGWNGMSIHHVISRSVRDSAAFLDATAGPALGDPYWAPPPPRPFLEEVGKDPGNLRIAFTTTPPSGATVDPACVTAIRETANLCESLGHTIEESSPTVNQEELGPATMTLMNTDVRTKLEVRAEALGREPSPEDVERVTWQMAEAGKELSAVSYLKAVQTLHRVGRQVAHFFEDYDILLSTVLLKPPIPLGVLDMMSEDRETYIRTINSFFGFTSLFNVTGQPSMSVPLHWSDDGLPVGLQFTARFGDEALLFRLASQLEAAQPWKDRRPSINL
ncbi:MAG: amidase [Desulfobacteraceae bacterium]|nr:amidase [Desulfobacteraceae bacterium]